MQFLPTTFQANRESARDLYGVKACPPILQDYFQNPKLCTFKHVITLFHRNFSKGAIHMKDFMKDYLPVAGVGLAAGFVAGIFVYAWAYFAVVGG